MSTLFEVPCPECGRELSITGANELTCPACRQTYHARMGLVFPVGEPPAAVPS